MSRQLRALSGLNSTPPNLRLVETATGPSFEIVPSHSTPVELTRVETTPVQVTPVEPAPAMPRQPKIRAVNVLQDSLTFGEEALYRALWANATDYGEYRVICLGFERMSQLARLTQKNCKLNCRSLIAKQVLEVLVDTDFHVGRQYRIYGYKLALQRQQRAGLTHVLRTRGVVFVDPASGMPLTDTTHKRQSTRVESTLVEHQSTPVNSGYSTPVESTQSTLVDSSPLPIRNLIRNPERNTVSTFWREVMEDPNATEADKRTAQRLLNEVTT